ncbi:MAG: hypothetical protein GXX85_06010 [Ignavibacteria bacterium]|nr:hypothetical protein [Ignavibacteria bacterium]
MKICIIYILGFFLSVFAQEAESVLNVRKNSNSRTGDYFLYNSKFIHQSISRSLPVIALSPGDVFSSPAQNTKTGNNLFSVSAFNFHSPDFNPHDILNIKSVNIKTYPHLEKLNSLPSGLITFNDSEIPDSTEFKIHTYLGGETGDPLIHIYTKPELSPVNKDKIIPSVSFSLAGKLDKIKLRFTGAYHGFFSTGDVLLPEMKNKNSKFIGKQNKQFTARLDGVIETGEMKKIIFNAGLISYYGWDFPPALGSLVHFETYNRLFSAEYIDEINGFNVTFSKETSTGFTNEMNFTKNCGIVKDKNNLIIGKKLYGNSSSELLLFAGINYFISDNYKNSAYLEKEFSKIFPQASFSFSSNISSNISTNIKGKAEKNITNRVVYSGEMSADFSFNSLPEFTAVISSVVKNPEAEELFGNFEIKNEANDIVFSVSGNNNLKTSRNNYAGLFISGKYNNLKCNAELSYNYLSNRINQQELLSENSSSLTYTNQKNFSFFKSEANFNFQLSRFIGLNSSYTYFSNVSGSFYPKHSVQFSANIFLAKGSFAGFHTYFFKNRTGVLQKSNDKFKKEAIIYNFTFSQEIKNLYFLHPITFSLNLENLFDNRIKFVPFGNSIGRTFLFKFTAGIK